MAFVRIKKLLKKLVDERGLTIVEFVIVTVVTGIVMVSVLPFFRVNVDSYVSIRKGKDLQQMARIGFNRMMAEMKLIESSLDIDYGYSDEIRFDIPTQNNINYELDNYVLEREGEKLVEGVQSLQFRYFRENGTEKGAGFWWDSDVWRVHVTMIVGDGSTNMTLQGQVSPRNIHL